MKRLYKKPEVDVIKVQLTQMIALSKVEENADPEIDVLSRDGGTVLGTVLTAFSSKTEKFSIEKEPEAIDASGSLLM